MKGRPKDLTQTSQSPGPAHYTIGAGRQQGGGRETKTEDAGAATADP